MTVPGRNFRPILLARTDEENTGGTWGLTQIRAKQSMGWVLPSVHFRFWVAGAAAIPAGLNR